jgi:hypothetical protein
MEKHISEVLAYPEEGRVAYFTRIVQKWSNYKREISKEQVKF